MLISSGPENHLGSKLGRAMQIFPVLCVIKYSNSNILQVSEQYLIKDSAVSQVCRKIAEDFLTSEVILKIIFTPKSYKMTLKTPNSSCFL